MNKRKVERLFVIFVVSFVVSIGALLFASPASAQDAPQPPGGAALAPASVQATLSEVTPDGFTVWRRDIGVSCSFSDHNYTLEVNANPGEMSDISYSMTNYDVDYNDPQGCEGGPEVDIMSLNGNNLGILTGANNSWSTNLWTINRSQVISGSNQIYVDTDAPGTGCWCVGVGYIEIRAKLGFKVVAQTPQKDDKNRDFRAANLDLTVSFSSAYDAATLTQNSFKLEYRNQAGAWQQVAGSFTQLAPEKFRFVPGADLKDGVRYRAMVKGGDAGVKSVDGSKLQGDTEWYFWTVPDLSKSDSYDYGSGSVCPPSTAPCPGFELAVFQVARNATMVPNKEAVARLYLRWNKHNDVLDADQVKEMEVDAQLSGGGSGNQRATIKRPDKYTAAERAAAANTVNIRHTPASSFNYTAEVIPQPQTNATVVKYNAALNLASSGRSPDLRFNYYFLKDGDWAAGAPAAAKTAGRDLFTRGVQFMKDVFPVVGANYTEQGDYSIGYTRTVTMTDTWAGCGVVWSVACPRAGGADNKTELRCIYDTLETMRGGNKFVAATVPSALCPNVNGMAFRNVFVHFSGSGANYGTVVHETGHIYTLGHIDTANNIEGFQVRTGTNRSFVENPTNLQSLMHTYGQPADQRWIDNGQYGTLLGTVTAAAMQAASTSPYLIVSGYIYTATNSATLSPAFLQDTPNDLPLPAGPCSVELLDAADAVLAAGFVDLAAPLHITPADPNAPEIELPSSEPFFSVSLPWSAAAAKLRVVCGGSTLLTQTRSANAPAVDFSNVSEGANLSGNTNIAWTGSDVDGGTLSFQLQFSEDGGATWLPITPLGSSGSFDLDTTRLPSGAGRMLRVLATDGFNTSYAVRTVNITNPLTVAGVLPGVDEAGAAIDTTVQALFASNIATPTLTSYSFRVYDSTFTQVAGSLTYDPATRMAIFTPDEPLRGNTTYRAQLLTFLTDQDGSPLAAPFEWQFTTGADTSAPFVVRNHPADDEIGAPTNTLIQVQFNEDLDPLSVNDSTLQLLDASGNLLAGVVTYNPGSRTALLIPAANLPPDTLHQVQAAAAIKDAGGNPLGAPKQWMFTTGMTETLNGLRIVGNYSDQGDDLDGDGLFERLRISVDVEVRQSNWYNLNARLTDTQGKLIQWATTGDILLDPGVHTLILDFNSTPIRSNGVDGSYFVDALNFYDSGNPNVSDRRFRAYQTFPYDVERFYSILTLGGLPDQLLEVNTTRDNAVNLRSFTTHRTLPISDVTYSILINTAPVINVTIDADSNIDINPPADIEAESDVTIEARDWLGNRVTGSFRISVQRARPTDLSAAMPLTVGTNSTLPVAVQIRDQFGRVFAQEVTVTVGTTLGAVDPQLLATTSGEASFNFAAPNTPGVAFIDLATVAASKQIRVEVTPMAVAGVAIAGPTSGGAGAPYQFSAAASPGSTTRPISYTWESAGFATILTIGELASSAGFTWTAAGSHVITVTAANAYGAASAQHTIVIGPAAPAALTALAQPASIAADGASTSAIRAQVVDSFGNVVPGVQVDFATTLGSITPSVITDGNGLAAATLTAGTQVGVAQVTATLSSASGVTGSVAVQFVEASGATGAQIYLPAVAR